MSFTGIAIIEDLEIIDAVIKGDREAYAALVREYQTRVRGLCLSILLNAAEADDAAQDVFVKALSSLASYRKDSSFSSWLYRIASNHCMDQLRKRKRQKTDSLDRVTDNDDGEAGAFQPRMAEPSESLIEKTERLAGVMQVLSSLPADYREVLVLREVEGLSYEAIRVILKCSLDAVKTRLHRARHLLQDKSRHFLHSQSSSK